MRLLLLTAIMIFASSASAGLYKWVDSDGNVSYSQKRPMDKKFERIKAPAPAPENSKPLYDSIKSPNKGPVKTVESEMAKNAELRTTNCAKAKKNLNTYQVHRRIRDKDGNVTVVDDKERARQIDTAKKLMSEYCN